MSDTVRTLRLRFRRAALAGAVVALAGLAGPAACQSPGRAGQPVDDGPPTAAEPFRGSPASSWADGADGITLPQAQAVNGLPASHVDAALRKVKAFLVAANLDPGVLRGGSALPAVLLIDSTDGVRADAQSWLDRPDAERRNPLWLFTRFDPAESRLLGPVKTRGTTTVEAGDDPGVVRIRAVYTFVYPVADAVPGRNRATRAVVRRDLTFEVYDAGRYETDPGSVSPVAYAYWLGNHDCGAFDGVVHPWFGGEGITPGRGADPYDLGREVADLPRDCAPVSRV
ncbi:hypothetical protein ACIGO8_04805 [Streptomyces sp. NPDC053493]|uniref:hypothetical protein n=1 Tax=Streptomyces sp. NPDC053493 TaxID=3365705 RepID=UPI0037D45B9D